jgi:hypothetical protein
MTEPINPYSSPALIDESIELAVDAQTQLRPLRWLSLALMGIFGLHLLILSVAVFISAILRGSLDPDFELLLWIFIPLDTFAAYTGWRVYRRPSRRWAIVACIVGLLPTIIAVFTGPLAIWTLLRLRSPHVKSLLQGDTMQQRSERHQPDQSTL